MPQTKKVPGLPEVARGKEGSSLDIPGGSGGYGAWPQQNFDVGLLTSRTMREYISIALSHRVSGTSLQQS